MVESANEDGMLSWLVVLIKDMRRDVMDGGDGDGDGDAKVAVLSPSGSESGC